jgi:hypothetical protein
MKGTSRDIDLLNEQEGNILLENIMLVHCYRVLCKYMIDSVPRMEDMECVQNRRTLCYSNTEMDVYENVQEG